MKKYKITFKTKKHNTPLTEIICAESLNQAIDKLNLIYNNKPILLKLELPSGIVVR